MTETNASGDTRGTGEADHDATRDEKIAAVVEKFTAAVQAGEAADVEGTLRAHPDVADELRPLLGVVIVTEEVARSSDTSVSFDRLINDGKAASNEPISGLEKLDDFEIVEELGRGGMGVVYKARQRSLDRTVALKVSVRGAMASSNDTARFRAEAQSAASLDHSHIVPVYEVGDCDGHPFFTMRYVPGETLAQRLARGPIAAKEAAQILLSVCRAVQHAHGNGVLHRDIKPSNILLDAAGDPYITDFGLAKRIEADASLTETGAILGSPSYMAPEQAAGRLGEVNPSTDLYGLGAVLYHMLTGRPPFQAATAIDTVLAVLEQDVLPPRLLQPGVDRDIEMIALKCLQKPQDLRYENAEALVRDLESYLAGDPVAARSTTILQVISRLFRDTHHAEILENWGLLWMLHSVALLALCLLTNYMKLHGWETPAPYIWLWTAGLGAWAFVFWSLRRRAGPITFVERQIAHLWGAAILGSVFLFLIEIILDLPVLTLSPVLGLINGGVFLAKAGILSGVFYVQAAALFLTAGVMAWFPTYSVTIFGVASALCFFIPGLQYHRRRRRRGAS